jgi:hypothetical protein
MQGVPSGLPLKRTNAEDFVLSGHACCSMLFAKQVNQAGCHIVVLTLEIEAV